MKDTQCTCFQCGRHLVLRLKNEGDLVNLACPHCGGMTLVKRDSEDVFKRFMTMFGSGGT